jgi:hypothetical protein
LYWASESVLFDGTMETAVVADWARTAGATARRTAESRRAGEGQRQRGEQDMMAERESEGVESIKERKEDVVRG